MAAAANKTRPAAGDPAAFLAGIESSARREDGLALLDFFKQVTGLPPVLWGGSIIGFGRYHYRYDSGREGDYFMTGFSPRKAALSIYILPGYQDLADERARLGKHKAGKSCLYVNRLADIDLDVLAEMMRKGIAVLKSRYPTWDE